MTPRATADTDDDARRDRPDLPSGSGDPNAELPLPSLLTRSERLILAASLPLACLVVWAGERARAGDLRSLSDSGAGPPRTITSRPLARPTGSPPRDLKKGSSCSARLRSLSP